MDHRVARCHLLAQVLADDGIMTEEEHALLERHLANLQLSAAECQEVFNLKGGDEAIAVLRERPSSERQEIVDQLVEAALADGKLTPGETATVKRIAQALGLYT
jgi:uncharacterized tellurite resistance protein B-like protein